MQQRFFFVAGMSDQYILVDPEHPLHGTVFQRQTYWTSNDSVGLTMPEMLCPTRDRVPAEPLANLTAKVATLGPEYNTDCMCSCYNHYTARTNYPH